MVNERDIVAGYGITATEYQNMEYQLRILQKLKSGKKKTLEQIASSLKDMSTQKVGALLRQLIQCGYVEKSDEGRTRYYELGNYSAISNIENDIRTIQILQRSELRFYPKEFLLGGHKVEENTKDADKIKSNPKSLLEFLTQITRLEANIYEYQERYESLVRQYIKETLRMGLPEDRKFKGVFSSNLVQPQAPAQPIVPNQPVYEKPGLFNKKRIQAENQIIKVEYDNALAKYNTDYEAYLGLTEQYEKDLAQYQDALKQEKQMFELSKQEFAKNAMVSFDNELHEKQDPIVEEIEFLKQEVGKTVQTRNELYATGVVYEKYRNYVSIATFCDYLKSGRCSELEGPYGAYNLYETELRSNVIISQLGNVLNSLNRIQINQGYLYEQLSEANRSLNLVNGQLLVNNAIGVIQLEKLDSINANTQVAAFYAKKNAELTNAIGFMMALK